MDHIKENIQLDKAEMLIAACRKAGIEINAADISPMHARGVANTIYNIRNQFVLRVSHDNPAALSDVRTESVASPVAYRAGIRCPKLISFDETCLTLNTPYTIYEFIEGETLATYAESVLKDAKLIYEDVGEELAKLHTSIKECPDPNNYLDHPRYMDAKEFARQMYNQGYIGSFAKNWLLERFSRLEGVVRQGQILKSFLHGDNHTGNIMVNNNKFVALIDWGDACWGDPASDFMYLPTRVIPHALHGYKKVASVDEAMELRILHYHLAAALYQLRKSPMTQSDDWAVTPGSRVFELLAAMTENPLNSWKKVLE